MTEKFEKLAKEAAKMAADLAYHYTMSKFGQEIDMSYPAPDLRSISVMARDCDCPGIRQLLSYIGQGSAAPADLVSMIEGGGEVQKMRDYVMNRDMDPARNEATWNFIAGLLQKAGILPAVTAANKKSKLSKVANKLQKKLGSTSKLTAVAKKLESKLQS